MVVMPLAKMEWLSADFSDDLQGKAESGFLGGFEDALEGVLQFLEAFYMP